MVILNVNNFLGWTGRKLLITIPYLICGLRFMYGWIVGRKHYKHEDGRWNLWRERWRKGEGLFGIKSEAINFFFFYHAQSLANIFFFSVPLILMTRNEEKGFYPLELVGIFIWIASFILENTADFQLAKFKSKNRNEVMCSGLWKYSRHPNYFFEFMLWAAYCLMTFTSTRNSLDLALLSMVPIIGYYFLVHFTGVPMCEEASLRRRGEKYRKYQETTPMFFPKLF